MPPTKLQDPKDPNWGGGNYGGSLKEAESHFGCLREKKNLVQTNYRGGG